jgi:hypothetical protein
MHSTSTGGATFSAVPLSPSANGTGTEQAHPSDYSEGRPGHSSVGSVGIPPQDFHHPQLRQDRLSLPLNEMGPTGSEPTWGSRTHSPVSPEDRTAQYPPQTQYFQYHPPNQQQFGQYNY